MIPLDFLAENTVQYNYRLDRRMVSLLYVPFYEFVNSPFEQKLYRIRRIRKVFPQYVSFDVPTISLDLWGDIL